MVTTAEKLQGTLVQRATSEAEDDAPYEPDSAGFALGGGAASGRRFSAPAVPDQFQLGSQAYPHASFGESSPPLSHTSSAIWPPHYVPLVG